MKIIIFGGQGFIGEVLTQTVKKAGHRVLVWGLPEVDIRDPQTFAKRLTDERPDAIINLVAILGTMKQSPSIQELYETNVLGNLNVMKAAQQAGVKNYIFASS